MPFALSSKKQTVGDFMYNRQPGLLIIFFVRMCLASEHEYR
jgi:hypothetical protein